MVDSPSSSLSSWFDEYVATLTSDDHRYRSHEILLDECAVTDILSSHRHEQLPFDQLSADMQAAEAIEDHYQFSMRSTSADIDNLTPYLRDQSTVVPHMPSIHLSSSVMETDAIQPCSLSPPSSPTYSTGEQTKKSHVSGPATGKARRPLLFEFMRGLLDDDKYAHIIEYLDRRQGVFKLHQPEEIAHLWQRVKGRNSDHAMTYEKVARALRYYYSSEVMKPCPGRFTFRFGPRSGFGTVWCPAH